MTDLFDEVEEQLRSDRYRTFARKALPWILALVAAGLLIFLAVWGWQRYREQVANKASEEYTAGLQALAGGDTAGGEKLLNDVAASSAKGYKTLALMQLGALKAAADKPKEAVVLFDQAAAAAPDEILGDAARLKSAFALLDTASFKDMEARLTPLMQDGRPYRVQAREALAFSKLMAGNTAGARSDFVVISQSLDAPDAARQRATAAMGLIDSGSAKSVASAAKAAAALPPMPASPAGMPQGLVLPPQQAPGPQ
ncbi:MAG: hypothetical protein JWQ29_450 [Phenylobacterium sp.]|nr:hypothetical protein [Phenylobacterium sp.]